MTTSPFDTHQTRRPTCPACGHEMSHDEMLDSNAELFDIAPNERDVETKCPACSVTLHVRGGYAPHYTTALEYDDLD